MNKFMHFSFLTFLACLLSTGIHLAYAQKLLFQSPEGKVAFLTSSFGESRGERYHVGLDFGTQNQEGWPVIAPIDLRVFRISHFSNGYGKALYALDPNGYTWVFAHLSGFQTAIAQRLNLEHYKFKKNELQIMLKSKEIIEFKKGDTLAFSGSTGVGLPHLHFEVRSPQEIPLNPALFAFVNDTLPPEITKVAFWKKASDQKKYLVIQEWKQKDTLDLYWQDFQNLSAIDAHDFSFSPKDNTMSIQSLTLRKSQDTLYHKVYKSQAWDQTSMKLIQVDLWPFKDDSAAVWHNLNPNLTIKHLIKPYQNPLHQNPIEVIACDFNQKCTKKWIRSNSIDLHQSYQFPDLDFGHLRDTLSYFQNGNDGFWSQNMKWLVKDQQYSLYPQGIPIHGEVCFPAPKESNTLAWMDQNKKWHASSNTLRRGSQLCTQTSSSRTWKVLKDTIPVQIDSIHWVQKPGDSGLQKGLLIYLHLGINKIINGNHVKVMHQGRWVRAEWDPDTDRIFLPDQKNQENKVYTLDFTDELMRNHHFSIKTKTAQEIKM